MILFLSSSRSDRRALAALLKATFRNHHFPLRATHFEKGWKVYSFLFFKTRKGHDFPRSGRGIAHIETLNRSAAKAGFCTFSRPLSEDEHLRFTQGTPIPTLRNGVMIRESIVDGSVRSLVVQQRAHEGSIHCRW